MPIAGLWRVALALGAVALSGCTLPWQQLAMPVPPPPGAQEPRKPGGAPLAKISTFKQGASVSVGTDEQTGQLAPRTTVSTTKDGITLNIVESSIAEAAKSILGDVLGVPYTVSDRVKGTVTIQMTKGVPKEALLQIFEDVLRGEGAAIVVQDGTYRVLPANEAVASAPLKTAGSKYRRTPGMSTHVVALEYVGAGEMERILK